jgi:hypothetical protein
LQHCQGPLCHTHYLYSLDGVDRGRFVVDDHDTAGGKQYFFYELQLSVTDQCGRVGKATRNILVASASTAQAAPDLGIASIASAETAEDIEYDWSEWVGDLESGQL